MTPERSTLQDAVFSSPRAVLFWRLIDLLLLRARYNDPDFVDPCASLQRY